MKGLGLELLTLNSQLLPTAAASSCGTSIPHPRCHPAGSQQTHETTLVFWLSVVIGCVGLKMSAVIVFHRANPVIGYPVPVGRPEIVYTQETPNALSRLAHFYIDTRDICGR